MRLIRGIMPLMPLAGLFFARCDCNPVHPIIAPPPFGGRFIGTFTLKTGEGATVDSLVQAIKWTFTETNYLMDADTSASLYDAEVCFCKGRGTYTLTDRVRLEPIDPETPVLDNCESCDPAQSPKGDYALELSGGRIKMVKIEIIDGIQVTSRIELERSPEK